MDYAKLAEAALTRAESLQVEARNVVADATLSDADKRSRVEAMNADIQSAIDEARSWTEQGERENEVRSLMERSKALHGKQEGRSEQGESASDQLRALARGEVRSVTFSGQAGVIQGGTRAASNVATTDGSKGESNTIPRSFVDQVIVSLREQSPIFGLSRIVTTTGGEPLDYPVLNAHYLPAGSYTAAEGTAFTKGNVTFAKVSLGATKYGALVEISRDLIEDSHIDFAGIVAQDMGGELGRKVSTDAVGKLVSQLTAGVTVDAGAATPVSGDNLMAMYHSIVTGYRGKAQWLFNDATALKIRTVKDSYGQYLWQPGLQAGMPDVLLGRSVSTDYNLATLPTATQAAPGAVVGVFGDFDKFVIRQVNGLTVVRSDEYGFDRDTVAFRVTWRGDFSLVDGAAMRSLNATHA